MTEKAKVVSGDGRRAKSHLIHLKVESEGHGCAETGRLLHTCGCTPASKSPSQQLICEINYRPGESRAQREEEGGFVIG